LERSDAGQLLAELSVSSKRLAEISQYQLEQLKNGLLPDSEEWRSFEATFMEQSCLREKIDLLEQQWMELTGSDSLHDLSRQADIQQFMVHAQVFTMETIRKLESIMLSTGTTINATKNHRKVMNAYYGMEKIDQEALYFDKKK